MEHTRRATANSEAQIFRYEASKQNIHVLFRRLCTARSFDTSYGTIGATKGKDSAVAPLRDVHYASGSAAWHRTTVAQNGFNFMRWVATHAMRRRPVALDSTMCCLVEWVRDRSLVMRLLAC